MVLTKSLHRVGRAARRLVTAGAACAVVGAMYFTTLSAQTVEGCGGTPPPPVCAMSYAFAKAAPGVLLLTGGGTFTFPTLHFLSLIDNPPGSGVCPPGPHAVTITATLTCFGGPGGTGTITSPIAPGFSLVNVPVTVPAGPPRLCFLAATSVVTLSDGTTLTQTADQVVCIVDPAPNDPSVPRLDMQHLLPGNEIVGVHPGDQSSNRYRITNNDPVEPYTGTLTADMRFAARNPGYTASGGLPQGSGPYALGDTGNGDNFIVAFADDLPAGVCVPLPIDPAGQTLSEATKSITLDPGESIVVDVVARPWGLCASGSCSESAVVLDGLFDDGTQGLACAGAVVYADHNIPPAYACSDSCGAAAAVVPSGFDPGALTLFAQPSPIDFYAHTIQMNPGANQFFVDGFPQPPASFQQAGDVSAHDDGHGRITQSFNGGFPVQSFFDIFYQIEMPPSLKSTPVQVEIQELHLVAGSPAGFEQTSPFYEGFAMIQDLVQPTPPFREDLLYQLSGDVQTNFGNRYPVQFFLTEAFAGGPIIDGHIAGQVLADPFPGEFVLELNIYHDFKGYSAKLPPPPCPGDANGDGMVDFDDLNLVLSNWNTPGPDGDVDNSGLVDFDDLNLVLSNWGAICFPIGTS